MKGGILEEYKATVEMTDCLDGDHQCRCLHLQYNDCYQGVTLEAWMCLTTYYLLGLLQVHQVHAKQDAPNEGNPWWHCSLQVLFALKSKVVTYVEEH
jgi:hypothetical protein